MYAKSNNFILRALHRAYALIPVLLLIILPFAGICQKGQYGAHDPSTITKSGNKYWMFATGNGVYAAWSYDLISWTIASKTVFGSTWPSWINTYVPNFNGFFWAPDCIYMNGKYYLYYSCSTWASPLSAIGVATSPTLDQDSPNYQWTDLGMVVSSSTNANFNAIDPSILKDNDGRVYMSYGSWAGGIAVVELDTTTGKVKSGSSPVKVSGTSEEGSCLIRNGSYYYLFSNRGTCCNGVNSTYYIVVGRSTSPTGPFRDQSNVDMRSGGGSVVLSSSGRFIGPGHVALMRENGSNFASIHYYDGNDNGAPKLNILNMGFNLDWPYLTRDWIASGVYRVNSLNSDKVWDAWGCTGVAGQALAQGVWANLSCQKWTFTPVGDGYYRITCVAGGRSVDLINCNPANNAKLHLWDWLNNSCQKFRLERAGNGGHVITPMASDRVIDVNNYSTDAGVQMQIYDYNGGNQQKWDFVWLSSTARVAAAEQADQSIDREDDADTEAVAFSIYPNPSTTQKEVNVEVSEWQKGYSVSLLNSAGAIIYEARDQQQPSVSINQSLNPGIYLIQVKTKTGHTNRRIIIQ